MHYQAYPKLQIQDIFKFLYQSAFGCEHFVASVDVVTGFIEEEYTNLRIKAAAAISPKNLVVVEGAYSMHPELEKFYNFSVFLDISHEQQRERILRRNSPELAQRFFNEWIPFENKYFEKTRIKQRCDVTIQIL